MFSRSSSLPRARRTRVSARAIHALLVALLALLQVSLKPGALPSLAAIEGWSRVIASPAPSCDGDAGDRSSGHDRRHVQCCLLCNGRDSSGTAPDAPRIVVATTAPMLVRRVSIRQTGAPRAQRPLGFATSWSPQAPPTFS
ncbi:hypothetical protein [Methylosinus sp. LW3]|uniref:hypothetical protein n=1 Tax=Methylosinus sp. LW3 TaxID=107635 RepID=UPI0012FAE8AC|nr:hypothetical protein [Methylosinus sp. LW3]